MKKRLTGHLSHKKNQVFHERFKSGYLSLYKVAKTEGIDPWTFMRYYKKSSENPEEFQIKQKYERKRVFSDELEAKVCFYKKDIPRVTNVAWRLKERKAPKFIELTFKGMEIGETGNHPRTIAVL